MTTATNKATDNELMGGIARGDETALADLYDRYSRLVMSVALGVVGDRATAEEVTFDVFMRVWQNAAGYDPALAKVPTWLSRLARNRAIDQLRREAIRPAAHSISFSDNVSLPGDQASGDTESAVQLALEQQRVREAVAQLPREQRQALALAYFQGYTHREIARLLDLSLGTVKGHIRGGMIKLRELLAADDR
jgi:RNA polymerase sigma-70 factor (ECF subfamily)